MIGISADYEVRVSASIRAERDGPMLKHGIQDTHGAKLILPARAKEWPNRDALLERFQTLERNQ